MQIIPFIQKTTGYNQDAINCIYKLVTAGYENVAFTIFETMTKPIKVDGTSPPIGRFLIEHLTKVNAVSKLYYFAYILNIYIYNSITFSSLLIVSLSYVTN